MNKPVDMTPDVVEVINRWQTGGAELWINVLQRSVECIACCDSEDAANRLKVISELIYLQQELKCFIGQKGGES